MSTLTALKLQRELEITRQTMAAALQRPRLVMKWGIDSETGRPAAYWVAEAAMPQPAILRAPMFA